MHACMRPVKPHPFQAMMRMADSDPGWQCAQETFKEYEKEAKLKPFAKAALAANARERLDPLKQAKADAQRWLRSAVLALAEQTEHFEVDRAVAPLACLLQCGPSLYQGRLAASRHLQWLGTQDPDY